MEVFFTEKGSISVINPHFFKCTLEVSEIFFLIFFFYSVLVSMDCQSSPHIIQPISN